MYKKYFLLISFSVCMSIDKSTKITTIILTSEFLGITIDRCPNLVDIYILKSLDASFWYSNNFANPDCQLIETDDSIYDRFYIE